MGIALPYIGDRKRRRATLALALSGRKIDGETIDVDGFTSAGDGGNDTLRYFSSGRPATTYTGFLVAGPGDDDYFQSVQTNEVSVKKFGAVGDGVTDDYAAINSGMLAAEAFGFTLVFPAGAYRLNSTIRRESHQGNPLTSDLRMRFEPGASLTSAVAFMVLESARTTRTVTADIPNGTRQITLSDASGLAAGDTIFLEHTERGEYSWPGNARETHEIESVDGNVITLKTRIRFDFLVAEVAVCHTVTPVTVSLENFTATLTGSSVQSIITRGVRILSTGLDMTSTSANNWAVVVRESIESQFHKTTFRGWIFGLHFDFCGECVSDGLLANGTSQPQVANTWSRGIIFRNALNTNGGDVIDGHPSFDTIYENCHGIDCSALGSPRGVGATVRNCTLKTDRTITINYFGPPNRNVTTSPQSGMNVTRFPWLSDFTMTIDGVKLEGPAAASGAMFIGGHAKRILISNCVAPGLKIESTSSPADIQVSNSSFGFIDDRHSGILTTNNVILDKNLSTGKTHAMYHTFSTLQSHNNLVCRNFNPATDSVYLYLGNAEKFLFSNCSLTGFLDWSQIATTSPQVRMVNSTLGVTNNTAGIPTDKFVNCGGTFGPSPLPGES